MFGDCQGKRAETMISRPADRHVEGSSTGDRLCQAERRRGRRVRYRSAFLDRFGYPASVRRGPGHLRPLPGVGDPQVEADAIHAGWHIDSRCGLGPSKSPLVLVAGIGSGW